MNSVHADLSAKVPSTLLNSRPSGWVGLATMLQWSASRLRSVGEARADDRKWWAGPESHFGAYNSAAGGCQRDRPTGRHLRSSACPGCFARAHSAAIGTSHHPTVSGRQLPRRRKRARGPGAAPCIGPPRPHLSQERARRFLAPRTRTSSSGCEGNLDAIGFGQCSSRQQLRAGGTDQVPCGYPCR